MKRKDKKRKFDLSNPKDREEYEDRLHLRHAWLLVDELEFQRKVRRKEIALSKKHRKQPWVI